MNKYLKSEINIFFKVSDFLLCESNLHTMIISEYESPMLKKIRGSLEPGDYLVNSVGSYALRIL